MTRRAYRFWLGAAVTATATILGSVTLPAQMGGAAAGSTAKPTVPTPRTADGKPDLSGRWGGGGGGGGGNTTVQALDKSGNRVTYASLAEAKAAGATKLFARNYVQRHGSPTYGERDPGMTQRYFTNPPVYKPEHWDRVQYLDMHGNYEDTNFHCMPAGIPRIGAPMKIVQLPTEVILMYQARNTWRVVPTDGRPHHPVASQDPTYMGDSIGWWEGDTLVVEAIGFNTETWLGWPGWFHSDDMKVVERFRREGNTLHYSVTVHDPQVLAQPWEVAPRAIQLNTSNNPYLEDPPCVPDPAPMVSRERG